MKASDLLVSCLEAEGISHIFGVPGEENADFMMSLEKSSIEFIITRHEQGAAFMAETFGRLTGQADTRRRHKESHQVIGVVAMYDPVNKWATSIEHPDSMPEIVRKSVRLARAEKPGAVLIGI